MSDVDWGNYSEAYKAIHDKLIEVLTKLDYPADPAVQDVIDRADRLLGRVYGSQGQQLKQRASTHELMVQLVHQGVEYQAGGGGGSGLVQCQIRNEGDDAWINEPYARDISDRATRALGKVNVAGFDVPLPSGINEIGRVQVSDVSKTATVKKIDLTSTGIIHTPASGKKIRVKAFTWSSNADVVTALRFGTAGDLLFPIQAKGVIGMNLVGCNIEGAVNEALYGYLSGTGTMKGTVLIEEI